jgi:uncharacterized protein
MKKVTDLPLIKSTPFGLSFMVRKNTFGHWMCQLPSVLLILVLSIGCAENTPPQLNVNPKILTSANKSQVSTTIGNFVTTAVQKTHHLDFVFIPTNFIPDQLAVRVEPGMSAEEIENVVDHFISGPMDRLLIGTMKGKDIRRFVIERSRERYNVDMETAGLWYYVGFEGGFVANTIFSVDGRIHLDDEQFYRIAISDDYFFGSAFPGYKFRNGLNFSFRFARHPVSLRESIRSYLQSASFFPLLTRERAKVEVVPAKPDGFRRIHEIQGDRHASPLINRRVTTRGVITALGTPDWYPWGLEFFIESIGEDRDNDPKTSEGLAVHSLEMDDFGQQLEMGDFVEVTGVVFEDIRNNGMGSTTLRFLQHVKVLKKNAQDMLPPPVFLSAEDRPIPTQRISTYGGRLMEKPFLNLSDGIDFWESLEGMRVAMKDPVILGFHGGRLNYYEENRRRYLNINVTPREFMPEDKITHHGGLLIDFEQENFNPQIVSFITNYLSHNDNLDLESYYSVGDVIDSQHLTAQCDRIATVQNPASNQSQPLSTDVCRPEAQRIEGVLTYNRNLFGGGEYAIVLPRPQSILQRHPVKKPSMVPLEERPISQLDADQDHEVTFVTYNLENLSPFQINSREDDRTEIMSKSIITNMRCPDFLNLVEIQDNNGIDFRGDQDAQITLRRLRAYIQSSCLDKDYEIIDIPPFIHGEGGQPGGNIRTAMIYNTNKLIFEERSDGELGQPAVVLKGGVLANNPGRIYPFNQAFRGSRRSPVVEFKLRARPQEKIYVIGNHLNSKLGDMDFWGNLQIARANSDDKRGRKTALINRFVHWLQEENPQASIVILGDFNALAEENSMSILTDSERTLKNMIFTLPKNQQYTTSHNGNSQSLDYIFVNNKIFFQHHPEAQILHINSDFMGRLSDHDPVVLKITYN